jgi:hypothetical protein
MSMKCKHTYQTRSISIRISLLFFLPFFLFTFLSFSYFVFFAGLPSLIANSGFPQGLQMSYNAGLQAVTVPMSNPAITIPANCFHLKGSFNILGFGGFGEVLVGKNQFMFNITLNPLKLGTLQLSRSKTDVINGPNFYVNAVTSPSSFSANMEGYVNLFLFQAYAKIAVTGMRRVPECA